MSLHLQYLREKIASARNLLGVVETMRGLAAVNIRRAEAAADEGAHYVRAVHLALHVGLQQLGFGGDAALQDKPAKELPLTAVLLTSDQGLCGQFNDRIVTYALQQVGAENHRSRPAARRQKPLTGAERQWIAVGMRGWERLEAAGENIVTQLDAPSSVEAIPQAVNAAFLALDDYLSSGSAGRLVVIHNRPDAGSTFTEHNLQLMPFQPSRWARLPAGEPGWHTLPGASLPPEQLLPLLMREQVFIDLFQAFTQSFAAENAARLASMQNAADNIDEHLADLEAQYRRERQDAITDELMDIMGGVEAVRME